MMIITGILLFLYKAIPFFIAFLQGLTIIDRGQSLVSLKSVLTNSINTQNNKYTWNILLIIFTHSHTQIIIRSMILSCILHLKFWSEMWGVVIGALILFSSPYFNRCFYLKTKGCIWAWSTIDFKARCHSILLCLVFDFLIKDSSIMLALSDGMCGRTYNLIQCWKTRLLLSLSCFWRVKLNLWNFQRLV